MNDDVLSEHDVVDETVRRVVGGPVAIAEEGLDRSTDGASCASEIPGKSGRESVSPRDRFGYWEGANG